MISALKDCQHWIFDMDGTLTIAQHDFDAMRTALGLPYGVPILEALDQLSEEESAPLHLRLNEMELEVANKTIAAEGAKVLLDTLSENNIQMGILTRNNAENIEVTLKAAGLFDYFATETLISRDCAPPKPLPDGIHKLLAHWNASVESAVMVGDYVHDLHAGRAAGVTTLYVDPSGQFEFKQDADVCIKQLTELLDQ